MRFPMEFQRLVYVALVDWFAQATAADLDEVCWMVGERAGHELSEGEEQQVDAVLSDLVLRDALVHEGRSFFRGAFFDEVCGG